MTTAAPVIAGWLARVVSAVCALINTRLLIQVMGVDDYAALTIVLSLTPWVALITLGVPNAAQNHIAKLRADAQDIDTQRREVVNAGALAAMALMPLAVVLAVVIQQLLLTKHGALPLYWAVILCAALWLNAFTVLFNQILYAIHRAVWPAVAPGLQGLLTTVALLILVQLDARSPLWSAIAVAAPLAVVFVISALLVGAKPQWPSEIRSLLRLVKAGRGFLLFSTAAQATLACDYVVMALLLSSDEIVQYNLASRLFGVILTLHAVVLAAAWTPMSDLFFKAEFSALRARLKQLLAIGLALAACLGVPIVLFMSELVGLLSGAQASVMAPSLVWTWVVYLTLRVWSDTFATALMSFNDLATMNRYVGWQALVSVPSQWLFGEHFGATGIVMGLVLSFLVTAAWYLPNRFYRLTGQNHMAGNLR